MLRIRNAVVQRKQLIEINQTFNQKETKGTGRWHDIRVVILPVSITQVICTINVCGANFDLRNFILFNFRPFRLFLLFSNDSNFQPSEAMYEGPQYHQ